MSARDRRRQRLPILAMVLAMIAVAFFALPFAGLLWRAPWSRFASVLRSSEVLDALALSLISSIWSTVLCLVFGIPLAWFLATTSFRGRTAVRALCTLSMVLPPVVGGVALFFALGRRGLVGQWLDRWFSIQIPFSTAAVVIAQTFVAMPFLVLTVESAMRQLDPRMHEAARTLGASAWYAFRRVTLPAVRPAVVAGSVLAWARALGEFGATITFAGNLPGTTQTLPLLTYLKLESRPAEAVVISLVLVAVSFAVLFALRERWIGALAVGKGK